MSSMSDLFGDTMADQSGSFGKNPFQVPASHCSSEHVYPISPEKVYLYGTRLVDLLQSEAGLGALKQFSLTCGAHGQRDLTVLPIEDQFLKLNEKIS